MVKIKTIIKSLVFSEVVLLITSYRNTYQYFYINNLNGLKVKLRVGPEPNGSHDKQRAEDRKMREAGHHQETTPPSPPPAPPPPHLSALFSSYGSKHWFQQNSAAASPHTGPAICINFHISKKNKRKKHDTMRLVSS